MHNSTWWTVLATTLSTLALPSCVTPQMKPPASIGADVAQATGVTPNWSDPDAGVTIDGASLRSASATPLPNPLSERVAIGIALDASPEIARMLAETDSLQAQAMEVSTPMNPVVNFASGAPLDSMSVVPIFAMLMVQIDELWKQPIRSEAAHANYEAALLSLGAGAVALASDARALWHEVAVREEECALAKHDLALTERLRTIAQERFAVGEGDGDSIATANLEFADAHHRVESANEMRDTARLALMTILGRAEAPINWNVGDADTASQHTIHGVLSDEPAMLDRLAQSRLDVRAAQSRVIAAMASVTLAQRGRVGRLELGAGWERSMENDSAVGVAANIELPIFNDGSFRIAKAIADLRAAEIAAERVRQTAIGELRTALVKARSVEGRYKISESSSVSPMTESVKRTADALAAGEAAEQDAIIAEHVLNHAKLELTDLERARRGARIALSKAAGFLPVEEMP